MLSEYQGSGFTKGHYLIVRADQQVPHMSRLPFVVASHLDRANTGYEIGPRPARSERLASNAVAAQWFRAR